MKSKNAIRLILEGLIGVSIGWYGLPFCVNINHFTYSGSQFKFIENNDFKSNWMSFLRNYDVAINGSFRTTQINQEGKAVWIQQEQPPIWVALNTSKRMLGWQKMCDLGKLDRYQNIKFLIEQWEAGPGKNMELMHDGRDLIPFLVLDINGIRLGAVIDAISQAAAPQNVDALLRLIATSDHFIRAENEKYFQQMIR